jgi:hypothetical protein
MGICVEPPQYVVGLGKFEQYIFRTQPEGHRSGPGDLDLIVYSLRKWVRLALSGNPTVLLPLFVPENEIVTITDLGRELRAAPELVLSRQAGRRFVGYLRSQRAGMLGVRRHTNRPELVETGKITLPIPEPWLTWLRDLRQGKHTKDEALAAADELEARLEKLILSSALPERPDHDRANNWLIQAYRRVWDNPIPQ